MLLAIVLIALFLAASAVEISISGESASLINNQEDTARDIEVISHLAQDTELHWLPVDENDFSKSVMIAPLPASSTISIQSYSGHRFIVKQQGAPLEEFHVHRSQRSYQIGTPSNTTVDLSNVLIPLHNRHTTHMSAKFKSLYPAKLNRWYDDGKEGTYQGTISLGQESTVATYVGHVFFFTLFEDKSVEVARFKMDPEQYMYVAYPGTDALKEKVPAEMFKELELQLEFMRQYRERTGLHWRHYIGPDGVSRPPPTLFMWPAEFVGQQHVVTTDQGRWRCHGAADQCQTKESFNMTLTVVSLAPRVFHIPRFLSDYECEAIIQHASPLIKTSSVGNVGTGAFQSDTRTSKNTWVGRTVNAITETLYRRAAHALNVSDSVLHTHTNAEDMQVVNYINGQKYDAHHDWGSHGTPNSRLITLLLYLTDMENPTAGGETSFPKGMDGSGFKVRPVKGSAVLFYNLLEDGNGDDLALHAALPCHVGEKWLANFWVWDPHR